MGCSLLELCRDCWDHVGCRADKCSPCCAWDGLVLLLHCAPGKANGVWCVCVCVLRASCQNVEFYWPAHLRVYWLLCVTPVKQCKGMRPAGLTLGCHGCAEQSTHRGCSGSSAAFLPRQNLLPFHPSSVCAVSSRENTNRAAFRVCIKDCSLHLQCSINQFRSGWRVALLKRFGAVLSNCSKTLLPPQELCFLKALLGVCPFSWYTWGQLWHY